eukprot:TRINITY_DN9006_c0_g1_i1.p1 TRINITY_DN9006_c0_g1~~TRINITY_DN9006_c0_g1_i1.p1  ORF type:complete len:348 (+),score=29.93 TRINITY_DN9006_c0_g1_i1:150-1193(+)
MLSIRSSRWSSALWLALLCPAHQTYRIPAPQHRHLQQPHHSNYLTDIGQEFEYLSPNETLAPAVKKGTATWDMVLRPEHLDSHMTEFFIKDYKTYRLWLIVHHQEGLVTVKLHGKEQTVDGRKVTFTLSVERDGQGSRDVANFSRNADENMGRMFDIQRDLFCKWESVVSDEQLAQAVSNETHSGRPLRVRQAVSFYEPQTIEKKEKGYWQNFLGYRLHVAPEPNNQDQLDSWKVDFKSKRIENNLNDLPEIRLQRDKALMIARRGLNRSQWASELHDFTSRWIKLNIDLIPRSLDSQLEAAWKDYVGKEILERKRWLEVFESTRPFLNKENLRESRRLSCGCTWIS